jgi:hypothetical protein
MHVRLLGARAFASFVSLVVDFRKFDVVIVLVIAHLAFIVFTRANSTVTSLMRGLAV